MSCRLQAVCFNLIVKYSLHPVTINQVTSHFKRFSSFTNEHKISKCFIFFPDNVTDIITTVFQYINLLKSESAHEWIYQEMQVNFRVYPICYKIMIFFLNLKKVT